MEQRQSVRRKERQRQCVMNSPQPPFPIPLRCLWGEGREKLGGKLSLGRREGWGKGVFKILFYLSLYYSELIGDKPLLPQVESVLPTMVIAE